MKVWRVIKTNLFNYYHEQAGLKDLLEALKSRLIADDIYVNSDQIVITSGSQQALYILSQMDFGNGGYKILLEQPTYHRMNQLVNRQNLAYETINRGFDGLDFDRLEEYLHLDRLSSSIPSVVTPTSWIKLFCQ